MRKILLGVLLGFAVFLSHAKAQDDFEPKLSKERALFQTNVGDIVVAFYPDVAPKHVEQVMRLAKLGIYENAEIFRIEKGFVAQVENVDPHKFGPDLASQIKKLPAEFSNLKHTFGRLSMARYDDPNSAEASFSFMLGAAPHLDHQYTIFGEVVEGQSTLKNIEAIPVDETKRPLNHVFITHAEFFPDGNLNQRKLNVPAAPITGPNKMLQTYFKIFAALAFCFTVSLAVAKNFFPKLRI